eukprot:Gb_17370 [translate_table: standard]
MAGREETIIPGLPNDMAMACLARVSPNAYSAGRRVCQSWCRLLHPKSPLFALRRTMGIEEPLYGVLTAHDPQTGNWSCFAVSLSSARFSQIKPRTGLIGPGEVSNGPSIFLPLPGTTELLHISEAADGFLRLCRYSAELDLWTYAPQMHNPIRGGLGSFAYATTDTFLYLAGGRDRDRKPIVAAERFDPQTNQWEEVCPMQEARSECLGLVLDSRFYVVGGRGLNSAEYYDSCSNTWIGVPDFLPCGHAAGVDPVPDRFKSMAVIDNQVLAIDSCCADLKVYRKSLQKWVSAGPIPGVPGLHLADWRPRLAMMGGEVWVVGSWTTSPIMYVCRVGLARCERRHDGGTTIVRPAHPFIQACNFSLEGPVHWRKIAVPASLGELNVLSFTVVKA